MPESGPQAWLARSLSSVSGQTSYSTDRPRDFMDKTIANIPSSTNRSSILPLPSNNSNSMKGPFDRKDPPANTNSSSSSSQQPNLKFLNRRKKNSSNDTVSMSEDINDHDTTIISPANGTTTARGTVLAYHNVNVNGNQVSSNPVANAKGLANASDKLRRLTIEMHHLKEERDLLLQDKHIWLRKIKDDNVRLTLLLQVQLD